MSRPYLFEIKRSDAENALRVLYEEDCVPADVTLEELRRIRLDVEEYIKALEQEVRRNGNGAKRPATR